MIRTPRFNIPFIPLVLVALLGCGEADDADDATLDAGPVDASFADVGSALDATDVDAAEDSGRLDDAGTRDDAGPAPACVVPGGSGECALASHPERPFLLYLPEHDGTRPLPVVLAMHGGGGNAMAGASSTCPEGDLDHRDCLHSVGAREGFVTVYPNGTLSGRGATRIWNAGGGADGWACVGFCRDDIDEAEYVEAVIDELARWVPVDRTRIYAAGLSNGAAVTHRLACEIPERLAGIVTIGGANQYATSAPCEPELAMPVLHVHGTEDGCWPYEGGPITCQNPDNTIPVVGAEPSTAAWADRNGCAAGPTTTPGPERGRRHLRRAPRVERLSRADASVPGPRWWTHVARRSAVPARRDDRTGLPRSEQRGRVGLPARSSTIDRAPRRVALRGLTRRRRAGSCDAPPASREA